MSQIYPQQEAELEQEQGEENYGEENGSGCYCEDLSCSSSKTVVDAKYCAQTRRVLTVWKKSLIFGGEGFTVYDSSGGGGGRGDLLFRVDCYSHAGFGSLSLGLGLYDDIVLMDAHGKAVLTLRPKVPSLHNRWEGFLGDRGENKKPLFTVRRSSILQHSGSEVDIFSMSPAPGIVYWKPCADYHVTGSFSHHSCTIFHNSSSPRTTAAEVKSKCGAPGVVLKDVFSLTVEPGFDMAFIMGVIVILHANCRNANTNNKANANNIKLALERSFRIGQADVVADAGANVGTEENREKQNSSNSKTAKAKAI